jgi:PAS domain S-box-containing protein
LVYFINLEQLKAAMPEQLTLSPALLSQIFSEIQDALCTLDKDGTIIHSNQAADELLGTRRDELPGKHITAIIEKEGSEALLDAIQAGEPTHQCKAIMKHRNGSFIPAICSTFVDNESIHRTYTIILWQTLISPGKDSGKTLRFEHLFESNMFGMVYIDIYNRILEANEAFLEMVGYAREDFTSGKLGWRDLTPQEFAPLDEIAIQEIRTYGAFQPFEQQFIRKDGSRVDILAGGIREEGSSDRVIAFIVDISAKKRAERVALKGEQLFRNMADCTRIWVWLLAPDLNIHYANKALLDYLGVELDTIEHWEVYIHPEDLPDSRVLIQNAFKKRIGYGHYVRVRRADGKYRWIFSSGEPVLSEDGEFLGYVGTSFDVQDIKEAQEKSARYAQQLEISNKELEHFATIASHDLQEPLRKVRIFSDQLIGITEGLLNEEGLLVLQRIQNATARMQHLIDDLLDLSKITRLGQPFKKLGLRSLTEEVITDLRYTYPDIHHQVKVQGDITIEADPNQIRQMLSQLLDNALKFHQPGQLSKVQVDIQLEGTDQGRITISDNGIGMKAEHLPKIFDTFVHLHHGDQYSGTGIGLALVKKIVERHHGNITVESTPGKGSKFTVLLPLTQSVRL